MIDRILTPVAGPDYAPLPVVTPDTSGVVTVAIGAASMQSAALAAGTYRLAFDVACYIDIGADPTASAARHPYFGAGYDHVTVSEGEKIAVKSLGVSAGTLWVIPLRSA